MIFPQNRCFNSSISLLCDGIYQSESLFSKHFVVNSEVNEKTLPLHLNKIFYFRDVDDDVSSHSSHLTMCENGYTKDVLLAIINK